MNKQKKEIGVYEWSELKVWEPYYIKWANQGRSEEQRWAVKNFMTGQGAIMVKDLLKQIKESK